MGRLTSMMRNHRLLVGFVLALAPLLVMLTMQYVWLCRLEQASGMAHKAALRGYLDAVGTEVEYFYRSTAERLLNVPAALFEPEKLDEIASFWKEQSQEGVRHLFVVDYTREQTGNFYMYDPDEQRLTSSIASEESLAILMATLPWQSWALEAAATAPSGLQVNERDPKHRMVLGPVADPDGRIVGVVGLVIDQDYFLEKLLFDAEERSLDAFFPGDARRGLTITITDEHQALALGKPAPEKPVSAVSARLPFVFTEWTVSLASTAGARVNWAGTFVFNMALGVLMAGVLLAGIGLALRTADRAMRLSEMKADFVSNVSHELRTPLASIRVFAELLRLGKVPSEEKVQEYGEYIETESRRLSRLIDNILDFSRIDSKRKAYQFTGSDVGALVETVARSFTMRLSRDGITLRVDVPPEPRETVEIDADAVSQALHNLIDNAAKYSSSGSEISVRVEQEDGAVSIAVQDQGIGIAKNDQAKVFDRFHRVSTGLVHNVKGSGLGLTIVDHIAKAHGGHVELESEPGRGSTFTLRLPVRPRDAAADQAAGASSE